MSLESLEITDFKSFKGTHLIGPLPKFAAIVGPNGSGKSNLMDAFSFVLGEKGSSLRVRKLGQLIHGASIGQPVSTRCRVQMNFVEEGGRRRAFSRAIVSSTTSEYRVDGDIVTPAEYQHALQAINIFIRARNFLVYQGAVEQVAMQSPRDLTAMIEELSRSGELKADYERLKAEMVRAEVDAQENMAKRRDVAAEKKEARAEKELARNYQAVRGDLSAKNRDLFLAQLFAVERTRDKLQEHLDTLQREADAVRERRAEEGRQSTDTQQAVRQHARELGKMEGKLTKENKKLADQRTTCAQARKEVEHLKTKLDGAKKVAKAAKKKADEHRGRLQEAERALSEAQKQKEELNARRLQESQQQKLNLDPQQIAEYRRLKTAAAKETSVVDGVLYNLQQAQTTDEAVVEHEKRKLDECNERIREKTHEMERVRRQIDGMKENVAQLQEQIQRETAELQAAEQEMHSSEEESRRLNAQLNDVVRKLSEAHGEINETRREQLRREVLENLKRVFPDKVHGRLVDLCTPSHKKYSIAVTKILQKHMNSVVCDTDEAARQCIAYLRERRHPPETFLPLNSIEVKPLQESLRALSAAKLVYDVIQCPQPDVRKALQFACGNALVADSVDEARRLAYGADRHRAVALDGTQFQPNGVISGGGSDLKARAKRWDEQHLRKLKDEQRALRDQLHALQTTSKRELDLEMKRRQIQSLESRVRYTQLEIKSHAEQLRQLELKLEEFKAELDNIQPRIEDKEEAMRERAATITREEAKRTGVEDAVFADFCARIGVAHIRVYEEREVHFQQESERQLAECDAVLSRLENELEYLRAEDREAAIQREKDAIRKLERDLAAGEQRLQAEDARLAELEAHVEALKAEQAAKQKFVDDAEAQHSAFRKKMQAMDKELHQLEKTILQQEQAVRRQAGRRHDLLHDCKLKAVELPLLRGDLDRLMVLDEMFADDSHGSQATSTQRTDSLSTAAEIEVDFRSLNAKTRRLLENEQQTAKVVEGLGKAVRDAEERLDKLQAPSAGANERMEQVKEREQEATRETEEARKKTQKARTDFEAVKDERVARFQRFFDPISNNIDAIYKQLSQNHSAQAVLLAANSEEPYLDGINYSCVAPGKRFRPMDSLSGGEKTIAALALLFAIHSANPSPFFVLDEIDAALDNTNINKVVKYLGERSRTDLQIIVISLKDELFANSDALLGVYPQAVDPCIHSGVLSLDLSQLAVS